jgi:hypothetical protein
MCNAALGQNRKSRLVLMMARFTPKNRTWPFGIYEYTRKQAGHFWSRKCRRPAFTYFR